MTSEVVAQVVSLKGFLYLPVVINKDRPELVEQIDNYLEILRGTIETDDLTPRRLADILYPEARTLTWVVQRIFGQIIGYETGLESPNRLSRQSYSLDYHALKHGVYRCGGSEVVDLRMACEDLMLAIVRLDLEEDSVIQLISKALT